MRKNIYAFTLVELIVVITIVGILSTVGFVSYSGYLTSARDSNRYSQMTKLSDSLQVYAATKSLPLPDDYVEITNSGSVIAYQGYVGTDVLETIDYTNGGKDPKDDSYFTYMLSKDRKSLQLLALMEESVAYAPGISKTYAVDYSNRYPVTYGQKLGVLTDTNNTPLQELSGLNGILDISNTTLTLKSFLSGTEFISGSGEIFADLRNIIPQRGRFWEVGENAFIIKCEYAEDITVGSYAVKACNVGAEYAGDYGSFFQWGENIAWDASTGVTGSNNCTWNRDTQSCTTPSLLSWSSTVSDTTSGGIDRWFDYGDTRGPCAPGYRVPTQTDWSAIVSAGGWGTNGSVILSALQLPLAGLRNSSGGGRLNVGSYAYLWSSSPYSPNAYVASISSSSFTSSASNNRVGGFPVRCIKN